MIRKAFMKLLDTVTISGAKPYEVIEGCNTICKIYDFSIPKYYVSTQDITIDNNSKNYTEVINGVEYCVIEVDIVHRDNIYSSITIDIDEFAKEHGNLILDLRGNDLRNVMKIYANSSVFEYIWFPGGERKFKPVSIREIMGAIHHKDSILKDVDLSCVHDFTSLLENSDIEEFDFDSIDTTSAVDMDKMFSGCHKLKRVYGHIKSEEYIDFSRMFLGCDNLEEIGSEVFEGVKVSRSDCMFEGCKRLKKNPMTVDNFEGIRKVGSGFAMCNMYKGCHDIDVTSVVMMLNSINKYGYANYTGMIAELTGDVKLGKMELSTNSAGNIFDGSKFHSVDMSMVEFIDNRKTQDILDLFIKLNTTDKSLPEFIIVNRTAPIAGIDGLRCGNTTVRVIDMTDLSIDEIRCKISLISAMNSSGHIESYVVVVDYV